MLEEESPLAVPAFKAAFKNRRLEEGAHKETVRKELCVLRKALKLAHVRQLRRLDPRPCFPEFKRDYTPRDRYLTEAEFQALLPRLPPKRQLWVRVAVFSGLRLSELQALRWEQHIDLDSRWIRVPGTKTRKSRRVVPIADLLAKVLSSHWQPVGPVLEPWSNARRDLAIACKAAGIARVTANDLRRTFASWLKHRNVNSKTVADLLGHTSTWMVDHVYGHLDDPSLIRAVETLSTLPESGSKWVTNNGRKLRQERQGRRARLSASGGFQQLAARPEGVEPPTFGFEEREH